mmetsp:Transcript_20538/g.28897  ORF Transcript_20538/g.28897 Transcript_20538/m.28897 type:complete len:84 (-) Transcript_20538:158-409(-)
MVRNFSASIYQTVMPVNHSLTIILYRREEMFLFSSSSYPFIISSSKREFCAFVQDGLPQYHILWAVSVTSNISVTSFSILIDC